MAFNNETSKNNYQGRSNHYQSNSGNKKNKRYDDMRENGRGNSGYNTYQNNKYSKDTRRTPKRDMGKYDKEGYQRNKHHNSGYNSQRYNMSKIQAEETIEDIKNDITRLEKEIKLEIESIKTIRFF